MSKTSVTINSEDKERLYEMMKLFGFERAPKKNAEAEVTYVGKVIKDCMAYASKNKDLFKQAMKGGDKCQDIEILIDILKEISIYGKCENESMKRIKDNRLFNILSDFISNLSSNYIRLNQKDDPMIKFIEVIRKPNATKKEFVNVYGALPNTLKDYIRPFYDEILRLRFDAAKKERQMTEEEQIEELTIKSKLENFDTLDSALTNLKKVLFDLQNYSGSSKQQGLRLSIKANISAAPEDTQKSLKLIYSQLLQLEQKKNVISSYSASKDKRQSREKNDNILEISNQLQNMQEQTKDLRNQIQQLTTENQKLQDEVEIHQKSRANDESALTIYRRMQTTNSSQKITSLQSLNAKLKQQLEDKGKLETASKVSVTEYNTMKRDLSSLREENDKLRTVYQEQTSRMNELIRQVRSSMNSS